MFVANMMFCASHVEQQVISDDQHSFAAILTLLCNSRVVVPCSTSSTEIAPEDYRELALLQTAVNFTGWKRSAMQCICEHSLCARHT